MMVSLNDSAHMTYSMQSRLSHHRPIAKWKSYCNGR